MVNKARKLCVLVLLITMTLALCMIAFTGIKSNATQSDIADSYKVGDTLVIPSRTLSNAGESANADIILYYPDGSAIATSKITFEEAGLYTVEYRAMIGGKLVKERESFSVIQNAFSVSGENSKIRYGEDDSAFNTGLVGLDVALAESETLNVNRVIDLKKFDGQNFFNFNIIPQTKGQRDASAMWIRLTDIHDPENYLSIKLQSVSFNGAQYVYSVSYALAAPCGQTPIAQDYSDINRVHVNDRFGQAVYVSFYGNADTVPNSAGQYPYKPVGQDPVGIIYKSAEKQLWIASYSATLMVADFDDPKYTQYLAQDAWAGFTSDEVLLSIEATGYVGSHFNFMINKLADFDLSEMEIIDDQGPAITIDTGKYDQKNLPSAVKGQTYPVFDATAFDTYSGERQVSVRAYYAYDTNGRAELKISNGRISTARAGSYALVYTAVDGFGNVSEKVLRFVTKNVADPTISLSAQSGTGQVGHVYDLPEYSTDNGSGDLTVSVTATLQGGSAQNITDKFIPRTAGTYTLTFTVTDVTGRTASANYTATVTDNSLPVFEEDIICPEYLILGQSYKFNLPMAYVYGTDSYVQSELYVNGSKVTNPYTPTQEGNITVKFVATNSVGQSQTQDFTVKVVKVTETVDNEEKVVFAKYFDAPDFTVEQEESCVSLTANATSGDSGEVKFIKSLMTHRFELGIKIDPSKNNYGRLQILISDASDPSRQFKIELVKGETGTFYSVNGVDTETPVRNGGFTGGRILQLSYKNGKLVDGGSFSCRLSELFPALDYNISFRLLDITGEAQVSITNISGQVMTSSFMVSNHKAQFKVVGNYPEQLALNSTLTINPLCVQDVLDTEVSVYVTVSGPKGKLLNNQDGFSSYQVQLSEYGNYRITYNIYNYSGRMETYRINVVVLDMEQPQISVNDDIKDSYKVGDKLTLPKATVSDNITESKDIVQKVLVVNPLGKLYVLESDSITFDKAGQWIIRYFAQDKAGNITLKDYKIKVA